LQPVISPGYGFTAIIVAFLGRLNPIGILIAGFVIALSYLGGEAVQSGLGVSSRMTEVLQGVLLFYVLACDSFILYRPRLVRAPGRAAAAGHA
jgi:simple sugar transport system permease protein